MLRTVVQVKPTRDFKVYVYFDDGKIKLYDVTHLIGKGVFKQISDIDVFTKKCTVINRTLAWDVGGNFDAFKCIDLDPEVIYKEGVDVADPLAEKIA
jgi:Protein of unknown function (DUF2442)